MVKGPCAFSQFNLLFYIFNFFLAKKKRILVAKLRKIVLTISKQLPYLITTLQTLLKWRFVLGKSLSISQIHAFEQQNKPKWSSN